MSIHQKPDGDYEIRFTISAKIFQLLKLQAMSFNFDDIHGFLFAILGYGMNLLDQEFEAHIYYPDEDGEIDYQTISDHFYEYLSDAEENAEYSEDMPKPSDQIVEEDNPWDGEVPDTFSDFIDSLGD